MSQRDVALGRSAVSNYFEEPEMDHQFDSNPILAPVPKSTKQYADLASRLKDSIKQDNVMIVSAGIAFFFFLALVPALGALVAIYGVVADPSDVLDLTRRLTETLPGGGQNLIISQLRETVASNTGGIGWGAAAGIVLALWSASTGTTRLITALNIAYDRDARSGFARKRGVGVLFTLGLLAAGSVGVYVGSNVLSIINDAALASWIGALAIIAFWIGTAAYMAAVLSLLYHYAPNRKEASWAGSIWGALSAVVLALTATIGFRIYVSNFANMSQAYGSMATIVAALLYLFIVAFAIIFGAEVDSQLQNQNPGDTG